MENQRLLRSPQREAIKMKCNISYVCTTSGLVQTVELLLLPVLAFLFVKIQIKDKSLSDLSSTWVFIQFLFVLCRLLPFLIYNVEEPYYFKRIMTLYEFGMTMGVLIIYIVAIPVIYSKSEPRVLNMMVFLTFGILLNTGHILWIIYKLIFRLA